MTELVRVAKGMTAGARRLRRQLPGPITGAATKEARCHGSLDDVLRANQPDAATVRARTSIRHEQPAGFVDNPSRTRREDTRDLGSQARL
jgi:hypothetical protein